jgi:hypothetical protein
LESSSGGHLEQYRLSPMSVFADVCLRRCLSSPMSVFAE